NEGLAELMGYAKFSKSKVTLQIPMDRLYWARNGAWIPFDRMLEVDENDPEYRSHTLTASFYAQSWLAVHYGMVDNRDFGTRIVQYINDLNRLMPQADAARKNFGESGYADSLLRSYAHQDHMSVGTMELGETPAVTLSEGKPLDDSDALAVLVDLMLEIHLQPD